MTRTRSLFMLFISFMTRANLHSSQLLFISHLQPCLRSDLEITTLKVRLNEFLQLLSCLLVLLAFHTSWASLLKSSWIFNKWPQIMKTLKISLNGLDYLPISIKTGLYRKKWQKGLNNTLNTTGNTIRTMQSNPKMTSALWKSFPNTLEEISTKSFYLRTLSTFSKHISR